MLSYSAFGTLQDYDRYRGVVNGRLSDIHRALSELLPTARVLGASPKRTTCLSCDQRVRSNGDIMQALGAGAPGEGPERQEQLARAASPQALPRTAPVGGRKPISSVDPIGAAPWFVLVRVVLVNVLCDPFRLVGRLYSTVS